MSTIVREMKPEDFEESCLFLRNHFYGHEPVTSTPDQALITDEPELREYRLSLINQGTSLVVVDQNEGGRIVGVALAGAMQPSELDQNWMEIKDQKLTKLIEHIHYFLSRLERNSNFFEHYGVSNALYLHVLAVDSSMLRQGLARRLGTALVEVGRAKGFPLLVATCTSAYSTRAMASLGMECVLSEDYVSYKDDDDNVVFKPPAPHTAAKVMAMRL